jgi:nicotinate phosphoribosyltransferase
MAHSLVMGLRAKEGTELQAFQAFHRYFPGATLLIDTYDTVAAAQQLAQQLEAGTIDVKGVRLDSGDLFTLSQTVRSLLPGVSIFASGDLDEAKIVQLRAAGACIDGYGVGTCLVTGTPVNGVYKLVEIDGIPVMKEASGKATYPGRKQIFRSVTSGLWQSDRLGLVTESPTASEQPLLQLVYKQGQRLSPPTSLSDIAHRTADSVAQLPAEVRRVENPLAIAPQISDALKALTQQAHRR